MTQTIIFTVLITYHVCLVHIQASKNKQAILRDNIYVPGYEKSEFAFFDDK